MQTILNTTTGLLALTSLCCERLQERLPGLLFTAETQDYTSLNSHRWSQTSILSPACIVCPKSAQDVSTVMKVLTADANEERVGSCPFSIKSGGHNPNPGANNVDGGISIDLGWLNETSLSEDRQTVCIGAGQTWGNVYDNLPGLALPGGGCGGTGVGGVALGGGMSLHMASVGWVADNIRSYEVVLADGEMVVASPTSHPDLFKALKGGGSNFGIVTSIELAVAEGNGTIYAGQIISPAIPGVTQSVLAFLVEYTKANNYDPYAALQVAFIYRADGIALIDNLVAHTDGRSDAPILAPFLSVKPQLRNTVGLRNMSSIAQEATDVQPDGWRDMTSTITFHNDLAAVNAIQELTTAIYLELRHVPDMDFIFSYVPIPFVVVEESQKRGGNLLGLENERVDRISMFFSPRWKDSQYDDIMYKAAQKWVRNARRATKILGKSDDFVYSNFAGRWQDPFPGYGKENLQFIKDVSKKYDPYGVFQKQLSGGFNINRRGGE